MGKGLNSTIATYLASKEIDIGEKKRKIKAITPFNGKPVCDFLLVINSNGHPISYRFGDIAAYCSNFGYFAFLSHPLGA